MLCCLSLSRHRSPIWWNVIAYPVSLSRYIRSSSVNVIAILFYTPVINPSTTLFAATSYGITTPSSGISLCSSLSQLAYALTHFLGWNNSYHKEQACCLLIQYRVLPLFPAGTTVIEIPCHSSHQQRPHLFSNIWSRLAALITNVFNHRFCTHHYSFFRDVLPSQTNINSYHAFGNILPSYSGPYSSGQSQILTLTSSCSWSVPWCRNIQVPLMLFPAFCMPHLLQDLSLKSRSSEYLGEL